MHAFKMLVGKPLARVHLKDRREGGITLRHMSERYFVRGGDGGNDSESWHMTVSGISGICSRAVLVIFSCGFQVSYLNATCMPVLQMIMSTLRADLGDVLIWIMRDSSRVSQLEMTRHQRNR
jgi:hypothetical protein